MRVGPRKERQIGTHKSFCYRITHERQLEKPRLFIDSEYHEPYTYGPYKWKIASRRAASSERPTECIAIRGGGPRFAGGSCAPGSPCSKYSTFQQDRFHWVLHLRLFPPVPRARWAPSSAPRYRSPSSHMIGGSFLLFLSTTNSVSICSHCSR